MNCREFDKAFDPYVDGVLDPTSAAAARMHVESCPECDRMVARWQQSRILLSTAVAEVATAVDVSGVLAAVEQALDREGAAHAARKRSRGWRPAIRERAMRAVRGNPADRVRHASSLHARLGTFGRVVTVAGASAVAAAASILLLAPGAPVVSSVPMLASSQHTTSGESIASPVVPVSAQLSTPAASGGSWNPRSVMLPSAALVDALEAGAGRTVSTWVQPRTQARVIWVQRRDSGPTLQAAGYEK